MNRIGILANPQVAAVGPVVDRFVSLAKQSGVEVWLADDLNEICQGQFCRPADLSERVELVIALGGDGTILRAARLVGPAGTPILGVNMGRLGFLAGAAPEELEGGLERLLRGEYEVEERMALEAHVEEQTAFALNEVVIEKGVLAHLVQVKTWVLDAQISSFFGNGLIVATPTGSTGYSLSAGGPVIHPGVEAMIVTPICAHSLSQRPLVIPCDQSITVEVMAEHTDIMLSADGQTVTPLRPKTRVAVQRVPHPVRLVNLQGISFYNLLRRKLDWSIDRREREE